MDRRKCQGVSIALAVLRRASSGTQLGLQTRFDEVANCLGPRRDAVLKPVVLDRLNHALGERIGQALDWIFRVLSFSSHTVILGCFGRFVKGRELSRYRSPQCNAMTPEDQIGVWDLHAPCLRQHATYRCERIMAIGSSQIVNYFVTV